MNDHPPRKVSPLYIADEVEETFRLLIGDGQTTELRILDAATAVDHWPHTATGYFDNAEDLSEALRAIKSAKGIYITPNPVDQALLARAANRIRKAPKGESTADTNITRRKWLLLDCDAQRASGISASDAEHKAAKDCARNIFRHLETAGWPPPIAADSGNGSHLLYRVDLPTDDGGLVKRCLEALAARFDDDAVKVDQTVFNPARIWKLYGSLACKGDDVPERPHRMSKIVWTPDEIQITAKALLETLAATARPSEPAGTASAAHTGNGVFDLDAFITRHSLVVDGPSDWHGQQGIGRTWTFRTSPMCEHHEGAAHLEQHAGGAISAGCHHNSCGWTWRELRRQFEGTPASGVRDSGATDSVAVSVAAEVVPRKVEHFQPFPVDSLPDPVRGFVIATGKAIGCDTSYLALPLMTVLASAIGTSRRIQLKRGWTAPAILWTAIVGESGTSKTPAFKLVLKSIQSRQHKAFKRHDEEMKTHEASMAHYTKKLTAWNRNKHSDEPPPGKPETPQTERCIVSDTTVEALAPILMDNPRGLLLARDELSGWISSFDKYTGGKGADSSFWLSAHDGGRSVVDRKTGAVRTMYIPQTAVCVVGGIQPAILRRALSAEHWESGLAARILLTCPPRKPKLWTEADIDPAAEENLARLVDGLFELKPTVNHDDEACPVVVGLNRDAKVAWTTYFKSHAEEQMDLTGNLSAAWSKLEEYAARLALVVHFTRWAAGDAELRDPDVVDVASMAAGVELAEWFKAETRRMYDLLWESDEDHDQRRLIEWIDRRGGSVTAREVQRGCRWLRESGDAAEALDELVKAGCGQWHDAAPGAKGGRPSRVFALSTSTQPSGSRDLRGCVDVDSVLDVHFSSRRHDWKTPQDLFDEWNARFGFNLDVCATADNAKCARFFTAEDDGLSETWDGVCWMNPPYGRTIGKWMKKAFESSQQGATVVCLVPARTDTQWWHRYATQGEFLFLQGRVTFVGAEHSAPFPSAIVIFRPPSDVDVDTTAANQGETGGSVDVTGANDPDDEWGEL